MVAKRVIDALAGVPLTDQRVHSLANTLYEVLHVGSSATGRPARDREFERGLIDAAGPRTINVATTVHAVEHDRMLVDRDGVRVWMPQQACSGYVQVSAIRPALAPGFLVIDGPVARPAEFPSCRLYIHLTEPSCTARILVTVLDRLDAAEVGYRLKVLSTPALYPRTDGLVTYLGPDTGSLAAEIAAAVGDMPGIGTTTSVFARQLCPGVAVADEPADDRPGMRGKSFGEHRALVTAMALLGDTGLGDSGLDLEFERARIDPDEPSRNTPGFRATSARGKNETEGR